VAARLLRHAGDLTLRVLGAGVQLGRDGGGRLGVGPPVPDQLALPLDAACEALRGRRDPLRCGLQLARRRRQLLRHGGELLTLALRLPHDGGDPVRRPVHAPAEVPKLVGSVVRHSHGQVAGLESRERGAGGAQPRDDAGQHRHERGARDEQYQRLLEKRGPRPVRVGGALTGADPRDEREARQVDHDGLPGLGPAQVERGLERGDQIRHVQEMPRRPDGIHDRGDRGGAHRHGGVQVPRRKLVAARDPGHGVVDRGEHDSESENERPGDGHDAGEPDGGEQHHAETEHLPAPPRARQNVLALFGAVFGGQLLSEVGRVGHEGKMGFGAGDG